jgi:hypothetical protein
MITSEVTQVESFEVAEVANEPIEISQEAISMAESLGLTGQLKLTAKRDSGVVTRVPFRLMTQQEAFIYGTLCPISVNVSEYDASPIPYRVLEILKRASELKTETGEPFFSEIKVWSVADGRVKDPVLVGISRDGHWSRSNYILARWGEELEELPALLKKAVVLGRDFVKSKMRTIIAKATTELNREWTVDELIDNGARHEPYIHA